MPANKFSANVSHCCWNTTASDVSVSLAEAHLPLSPVESVKRHRGLNLTLQNSCEAHYITTLGCFGVLLISHGAQHAAAICCSRWMRYPGNGAKAAGPFPHKLEHLSKPKVQAEQYRTSTQIQDFWNKANSPMSDYFPSLTMRKNRAAYSNTCFRWDRCLLITQTTWPAITIIIPANFC